MTSRNSEQITLESGDKTAENTLLLFCEDCQLKNSCYQNFDIVRRGYLSTFICCCLKFKYPSIHNARNYEYETCCLVCRELTICNFGKSIDMQELSNKRICGHCRDDIKLFFLNQYFDCNSDVHDYARKINFKL